MRPRALPWPALVALLVAGPHARGQGTPTPPNPPPPPAQGDDPQDQPPPQAQGQDPDEGPGEDAPPALPDPDAPARERIEAALDGLVTLDLAAVPLPDALVQLRDASKLDLVLDPDVPVDPTVTLKLQGVPARRALDEVLHGQRLQVRVWSGALLVLPTGKDLGAPPRVTPGPLAAKLLGAPLDVDYDESPLRVALPALCARAGLALEVDESAKAVVGLAGASFRVHGAAPSQVLTLLTHLHGLTWRVDGEKVRIERRRPRAAPAAAEDAGAGTSKEELTRRLGATVSLSIDDQNLYDVAAKVTQLTGIPVRVVGVDKDRTFGMEFDQISARDLLDTLGQMAGASWTIEDGGVVFQALAPCPQCGEPRGNVSPCPNCGAR
jgi:hypothetical protein